jgi:hypothetical protein
MADPTTDGKKSPAPQSENVTTRVNVAFPFSQIKVEQPSEDVAALAALVRDLADLVAEVAPGAKGREIRQRARALAVRLA